MKNKKIKRKQKLRTLFTSTFYLSMFTFGGGYVIVPLLKEKFVDELGWIDEEEMLNLVAIAQTSPGAIALNTSMLLGYQLAGFVGAMVAVVGTTLPPLITISIISLLYSSFKDNRVVAAILRGAQAGVAAVVTNVVLEMAKPYIEQRHWLNISIMIIVFLVLTLSNINVIFVILAVAIFGALLTFYYVRKGRR